MDEYLKYIDDKKFIRWVHEADEKSDLYWSNFLKEHPEEKKELELARLIVSQLKSKTPHQFDVEVLELYAGIVRKIDQKKKIRKQRQLWISISKYAAIALIFLAIGILFFSKTGKQNFGELEQQLVLNQHFNESKLIMGDGDVINISQKNSKIQYLPGNTIIINDKDTIRRQQTGEQFMNQLIVPYGRNSSVQLPDGTVAWLNAGSRLIYPSAFEGKTREVFLVGEGFFKVAHNPEMPFFVKTNDINVEALGTSFNVSAYPVDQNIEVVLVEGRVGVKENVMRFLKKPYILEPNQMASFNRETLETSVKRVSVDNFVSWYLGYLNFESISLNQIVLKLERYYDIKIQLKDSSVGSRKITGKLKLKDECEDMLKVLASTADLRLIKENDKNYVLK